ncbi:poly(ADP-ribose) glycohydrolase [Esox lucius]|uniref:poly(ADP-ribose) glycohydrolase n=2 Tax=Esox lucius TaxID=8010 RepID=A0A3P8Z8X6_ESOLU|nr:poly(ADP-ribose) glycohydrolase [Esox lucius]XP_010876665.2 poly(ADP-ribose) glycohydrolase [Esox lucius]
MSSCRNDSSQMKAALQHNNPMEGQSVEHRPCSKVPVGDLLGIPGTEPLHTNRESDQERTGNEAKEKKVGARGACGGSGREGEKWDEATGGARGEEKRSYCCCLRELKRVPKCHVELEPLAFSRTHTIFIDVNEFRESRKLRPQPGQPVWHKDFVKMPFSPECHIRKTGFVSNTEVVRWQEVSKQLDNLARKTNASVADIEKAIKKYNPKYEDQWSFDALHAFVQKAPKEENYYSSVLPKMAKLASNLPNWIPKAIPLLQKGQSRSITLSQMQIACLLANAFFCTFPHRNSQNPRAEYHNYPTINFNSLFGVWSEKKREKLRALFHYFHTVTNQATHLQGLVTFERRCIRDKDMPNWMSCKETLPKLYITSKGCIEEEGTGMLQVDFANNMIGGGVLGSGLVQEEILFLMNPELIVSRLFTERLGDNECLFIKGSQQFSGYCGYSDTFEWAGPHRDDIPRDEWMRLHRQIVAIDALHFRQMREQYNMGQITRELNKAYCGFKPDDNIPSDYIPDIATGSWGCGAFNGDPKLKALIQLMAAAKVQRNVAFFTFNNVSLEKDLKNMYDLLVSQKTTVGKLYELLGDYCAVTRLTSSPVDLSVWLRNTLEPRSQLSKPPASRLIK